MGETSTGTPSSLRPPEDRLDSWKEIAAYLNRDVTTVQRWEKREGMPVHRHLHDRIGSVYASRAELDAWARSRKLPAALENGEAAPTPAPPAGGTRYGIFASLVRRPSSWRWQWPYCWRLVWSSGSRGETTSGETRSLTHASRRSRISMEWRETRRCPATASSWLFSRIEMGRWMCGSRRWARVSSTI